MSGGFAFDFGESNPAPSSTGEANVSEAPAKPNVLVASITAPLAASQFPSLSPDEARETVVETRVGGPSNIMQLGPLWEDDSIDGNPNLAAEFLHIKAPRVPALEDPDGNGARRDIVQGSYYGGLKIWSCTQDVCYALLVSAALQHRVSLPNARVAELGCGHGLPGIAALRCGASFVTFHDYNAEVFEACTMVNVGLAVKAAEEDNSGVNAEVEFVAGDWTSFEPPLQYDVLLGADVTFDDAATERLANVLSRTLAPGGVAVIGTKEYYFGTGGGRLALEQCCKKKGLATRVVGKTPAASTGEMARALVLVEHAS